MNTPTADLTAVIAKKREHISNGARVICLEKEEAEAIFRAASLALAPADGEVARLTELLGEWIERRRAGGFESDAVLFEDVRDAFTSLNQRRREADARTDAPCAFAEKWRELRGRNLACFCKIGEPCHADTLLEIANGNSNDKT